MINEIKITQKYKSLSPFTWTNVPRFAVIAGVNGSGKTQLLELIHLASQQNNTVAKHVNLLANPSVQGKVQYIPAHQQFGNLEGNAGTRQQIEARTTQIIQYAQSPKEKKRDQNLNNLLAHLEQAAGRDLSSLETGELERLIPPNYVWYLDNGFNNQYIAELFKAYQAKVEAVKLEFFDKKQFLEPDAIHKQIGFPPPWELINEIFDRYGFAYHIRAPGGHNVHYNPVFQDKRNDENSIQFGNLSSGEKIIVSLVLWAFNQKLGEKNAVFLLDEFDAHLNPSMSRMFIEIVQDKLVKEYGIQVIMTSHSPSTIAYVDPQNLFWMERGKEFRQGDKKRIINLLSDGIMTYDEASQLLSCLVTSKEGVVLFTEGATDVVHLSTASEKLSIGKQYEMFPCNGANKLKQFLVGCPQGLIGTRKIVGIFDYDYEGRKCIAEIQKEAGFQKISDNLFVSKSNPNAYAVIIPVPKTEFVKYNYCPIEFLYDKSVLDGFKMLEKRDLKDINSLNDAQAQLSYTTYQGVSDLWFHKLTEMTTSKTAFANSVGALDPKVFENFKPIFDILGRL